MLTVVRQAGSLRARAAFSVYIRICYAYGPYTNLRAALIDAHRVVEKHGLEC